MRALQFHRSALKELADLPAKHFKQIVSKVFGLLENPMPNDARALRGQGDPMYRVSSGEYRIAYRFNDSQVFIEAIGARNDDNIYREIARR